MATAIIRAVVVASSCRQNIHDYISTTNCQQVKSASSSKTSSPLKPAQCPQPSVAKDETFILATCLCQTQLPKDQQHFEQQQLSLSTTYWLTDHSIESFSTANISASTAIVGTKENEVGVLSNVKSSDNNNSTTSVALGALKQKQSPLFGRKSLSNSRSFSLRSEQPFYVRGKCLQTSSLSADIEKQRQLQQQQQQLHLNNNVDHTALEAITMNYTASNGPRNATNSRNTAMDINRNNGYTLNGSIMTSTAEKREHLYKILVIGELGTGKTSFIKRYVHQFFSQNYRATIGVDFALKVLHWDANTIVRLQLWDIAGQERFGNMTRVYYKEAVGAFIVFDVTRSGTFDCVSKWKEDLDSKVQLPDGSPIPCILLANKCDQDKQGIVATPEKMDEYVRENGFAGWFETSAKENVNIDEAARALVNKILLNDKLISASDLADSEKFNLNNSADQTATETKSKCSC